MADLAVDPAIMEQERRCISSLVDFRREFFPAPGDVEAALFHHQWSRELLFGRGNYAAEGFRESAKDQYIQQAFPLHCLTYPTYERSYLLFIGPTISVAAAKMGQVTKEWLAPRNAHLRLGLERVVVDREGIFEVLYEDGLRLRMESYGRGSAAVRGAVWGPKRPDIVVINDIQNLEDMYSAEQMEKDWKWFMSEIKMLGYTSRIFAIGNNLGKNCVMERLADNARALNFRFERFPMLDAAGHSTWPAKYSDEFCHAERRSYEEVGEVDTWNRERMCVAMAPESRPLKVEDVRYYDEFDFDLSDAAVITMTDPGISEKEEADPTVIVTVAIKPSGWYMLDLDRRRRNPTEQVEDIFRAVAQWSPQSVGIETVAYQEALAHYVEAKQKETGIYFNVVRVKSSKNKKKKITNRLQPKLRAGALFLPRHASWKGLVLDEIREHPTGAHDDILDAVAMVEEARTERLIDNFSTKSCICGNVPIPVNWPFWCGLSASPEGEAMLLFVSCSPAGTLYVTDEIFVRGTPEELFNRYKAVAGTRAPVLFAAPDAMFRANRLTGNVWVESYVKAGFTLVPAQCDYKGMVAALNQRFAASKDCRPQLQVFARCKRLNWELYNALAGEQGNEDRKGIQALMNVLACGPRWLERGGAREAIRYPVADVW